MRRCRECNVDISNRGNRSSMCECCYETYKQNYHKIYNKHRREIGILKPGKKQPFKIDDEGCGNNRRNNFPMKKRPYMSYWINNNGEPVDKYLVARGRAIEKLNNTISNLKEEKPVERTRKEIYKGWVY